MGETPWVFVNTFFFLSNVHLQVLASSVTVITPVFHYGWFSNSIISSTFASILSRKSFPSLSQWKNGQWGIFITGSSVRLTFSHLSLSTFFHFDTVRCFRLIRDLLVLVLESAISPRNTGWLVCLRKIVFRNQYLNTFQTHCYWGRKSWRIYKKGY